MTEKSIEDYKNEMIRMHRMAVPSSNAPLTQYPQNEVSGYGILIVQVTTGRGSRPIQNAVVNVFRQSENEPFAVLRTDDSGKTRPERLPAPRRELSETPSTNGEAVFSLYNISVAADGYLGSTINDVPIFADVVSLQSVDLVWLPAAGARTENTSESEGNPYTLR